MSVMYTFLDVLNVYTDAIFKKYLGLNNCYWNNSRITLWGLLKSESNVHQNVHEIIIIIIILLIYWRRDV